MCFIINLENINIFLGDTLLNLRKDHSYCDVNIDGNNGKTIDEIQGKAKTYVTRTTLNNNAKHTKKKRINLENTIMSIGKKKTPERLITAHLIYSNEAGLQIMFSGDAALELSEEQLAYVQQECIKETIKLQSEAVEQKRVPPTKIEIELL